MKDGNIQAQKAAWLLSLAGFVPFAALALALVFLGKSHPLHVMLGDAFRLYSVITLSFLGGIRWGLLLRDASISSTALVFSVVPAILGWLAMFLAPAFTIAVLLLGYSAQGAWDSISLHDDERLQWFARLRITLTLLVVAAHIVALLSMI